LEQLDQLDNQVIEGLLEADLRVKGANINEGYFNSIKKEQTATNNKL